MFDNPHAVLIDALENVEQFEHVIVIAQKKKLISVSHDPISQSEILGLLTAAKIIKEEDYRKDVVSFDGEE